MLIFYVNLTIWTFSKYFQVPVGNVESECRQWWNVHTKASKRTARVYGTSASVYPQKTIHIRSDQSYVQSPCTSTDIHTLFSQLRLTLWLKRVNGSHLSRHFHRPFHTVVQDTFAGCSVQISPLPALLTLHCQRDPENNFKHLNSQIKIKINIKANVESDISV